MSSKPIAVPAPVPVEQAESSKRPGVKQQTAYLKIPVYEQLRRLALRSTTRCTIT